MGTSAHPQRSGSGALAAAAVLAPVAYALGAAALLTEAVVHVQQYISVFHEVRWVGPLFLANAAGAVVAVAGMAVPPLRSIAALAGLAISVLALGGLVLSYAHGFLGWQEAGLRTPVEIALIAEVAAVLLLAVGLTLSTAGALRR